MLPTNTYINAINSSLNNKQDMKTKFLLTLLMLTFLFHVPPGFSSESEDKLITSDSDHQ